MTTFECSRTEYAIGYETAGEYTTQHPHESREFLEQSLRQHPERYHPEARIWRVTRTWQQTEPVISREVLEAPLD